MTIILYFRQARRRSRSITSKYSSSWSSLTVMLRQARQLADQPARVRQMIGDANAVKAQPAVKIHHFGHGQFAVGVIRVDVKIAKQHAGTRRGRGRGGGLVLLRRRIEQAECVCASGRWRSHSARTSSARRKAASGLLSRGQISPPFLPEPGLVGKRLVDEFGHLAVAFRHRAEAVFGDQSRIAFLLAGDDLVDDHRAARGDGFLHASAAGFADDEVAAQHQLRHLVGPAEDAHAVGAMTRLFQQFRLEFRVAAHRDGQLGVGNFQQPVDGLAGFFLAGVDDVQNPPLLHRPREDLPASAALR